MAITSTWTDPSEGGDLDLSAGDALTADVWEKLISNLLFLGGAAAARFKVGSFTRDISTATGTQAVTGVGFQPRAIVVLTMVGSATGNASIGFSDGTTAKVLIDAYNITANTWDTGNAVVYIEASASDIYIGQVNSFDTDGFTIGWTKTNSPTGTATIMYLAFK